MTWSCALDRCAATYVVCTNLLSYSLPVILFSLVSETWWVSVDSLSTDFRSSYILTSIIPQMHSSLFSYPLLPGDTSMPSPLPLAPDSCINCVLKSPWTGVGIGNFDRSVWYSFIPTTTAVCVFSLLSCTIMLITSISDHCWLCKTMVRVSSLIYLGWMSLFLDAPSPKFSWPTPHGEQ